MSLAQDVLYGVEGEMCQLLALTLHFKYPKIRLDNNHGIIHRTFQIWTNMFLTRRYHNLMQKISNASPSLGLWIALNLSWWLWSNDISGCFNLSLVHTVIYNYMQLLNQQIARKQEKAEEGGYQMDFKSRAEKSRSDLIMTLREACHHMLHSHDGSRLTMNCLW